MLLPLLTSLALAAAWPNLDTPARSLSSAPSDAAVVVGVEHYDWLPLNLDATRDAELFASWLLVSRGVPVDRVTRLTDPKAAAWATALERAAAKVGPDGTLWVYFAGHGAMAPMDGVHALLMSDARANDASVSVEGLQQALSQLRVKQVVLVLDTSFSGVGREAKPLRDARTVDAPPPEEAADPRVVTWLGTGAYELPAVLDDVHHGAFTWHVVGALRGWADGAFGARDGAVSVEEAQAWVLRRMSALGLAQTPSIDDRAAARQLTLSTLDEPEPDLTGLTVTDRAATDPVLAQQRAQQLARANVHSEYERQVREKFQDEADEAWRGTYTFARGGTDQGLQALRDFLARFSAVSYSLPDGTDLTLSASQVSEARRLLQTNGRSDKPLLDLVRIDPGKLRVGSPAGTPGRSVDETLHDVTLTRAFEISRTEIPQHLWATVMGSRRGARVGDTLPIERVTWYDAIAFCNALSVMEGLTPAYVLRGRAWAWDREADGYRLPTEAEWTLAAQGALADEGTAACGHANVRGPDAEDGAGDPGPLGRFECRDGFATTNPVRALPADTRGLYGMLGNVGEWVWDAWTVWDGKAATDPAPDAPADTRVVKGGSFRGQPADLRLASRRAVRANAALADVGFRVVRTVP
jgi:formylglycine-generating enzyme required for sulfatase activity